MNRWMFGLITVALLGEIAILIAVIFLLLRSIENGSIR